METHPVPQNISSYEFRLVGDMTLKQFLQLAGGIVVGLIFFRLPIIGLIKYPLTFVSVVFGILMAFVPINGRPFSTWLSAFMKAIYSPTEYAWRPSPPPSAIAAGPVSVVTPPQSPAQENQTIPEKATNPQFVPSFSSLITSKLPNVTPVAPTQTTSIKIETPPAKKPEVAPPPTQAKPVTQVKQPVFTPPSISLEQKSAAPAVTAPPQAVATPPAPLSGSIQAAPQAEATSQISAPTVPNVLTGMVNDSSGQPMNGITVEIIDTATGIPARALRTNRLGQFQIAIPLTPGTYNVIAEKEGLNFEPVSIQVKGAIIPPIILTAKA